MIRAGKWQNSKETGREEAGEGIQNNEGTVPLPFEAADSSSRSGTLSPASARRMMRSKSVGMRDLVARRGGSSGPPRPGGSVRLKADTAEAYHLSTTM